jgi:2-polyprenyl-3-methyl-5-hydroxy-6-metoxy-1,4-benzoquinol methylase
MEPTEQNLRAWEDAHRSPSSALPRRTLGDEVRAQLPALASKHVLQLACGDGGETAELAALGALVTAVDVPGTDLEAVRERAPTAALVHVDFEALPAELRRARFDVVFASVGSLDGVADLGAWATGIAGALKPGGVLVVNEHHPVADHLDAFLHWRGDYFADLTVGRLVAAVLGSGLHIRSFEELPPRHRTRPLEARPPEELLLVAAKPPRPPRQRRQA